MDGRTGAISYLAHERTESVRIFVSGICRFRRLQSLLKANLDLLLHARNRSKLGRQRLKFH